MGLKDLASTGYYTTNKTLEGLNQIADATNEASLMQQPVKIQGGTVTPFDTTQGTKLTTKGMVTSLWNKFTNFFKFK